MEIKRTLPWVDPRRLTPADLVHLYRTIIHDLPQEAFVQLEALLSAYAGRSIVHRLLHSDIKGGGEIEEENGGEGRMCLRS